MAFTETIQQYQRWHRFFDYEKGKADGWTNPTLAPERDFELTEIRLKLSSAFASAGENFVVRLYANSTIGGGDSAYNLIIVSQSMSDIKDFIWRPEHSFTFLSGDQLSFLFSMDSNSNAWGLVVIGWAIAQR